MGPCDYQGDHRHGGLSALDASVRTGLPDDEAPATPAVVAQPSSGSHHQEGYWC